MANPSFIGGSPRYDLAANCTSLHNTVELDLILAKLVKLNIIQQLPSHQAPRSRARAPPMTKTSFTATEMASPCKPPLGPLAPGRFDRSSVNSESLFAVSQFDQRKVARVEKGLVSICSRRPSSAPHRAPLLSCAPLSCAPLIPRPSACSSALVLRLLLLPLPN